MKAIGYRQNLPIEQPESLIDLDLPEPQPGPRDLRVRVAAISVNPVDTKVRRNAAPETGQARVLGWDAVGTVDAVGSDVTGFAPGDRVYYAGSIVRPGANSELHLVDERIAARAPATLGDAEAAALPLTAITAWELLFDRLQVPRGGGAGQTLLITGGAGGVGSILNHHTPASAGFLLAAPGEHQAPADEDHASDKQTQLSPVTSWFD